MATLGPVSQFRLLDLSALLTDDTATDFESLDMALHMADIFDIADRFSKH